MSDQTTDTSGDQLLSPQRFTMNVPGWWPRIQVLDDIGDQPVEEIDLAEADELRALFASLDPADGTRFVSIMMSADPEPRPMGLLFLNHSDKAGQIMSGLLGLDATPEELPTLASVGKLQDTQVTIEHFDAVGSVSCVTARRRPRDPSSGTRESLMRAYLIPQPQTFKAVLVVFVTAYHDEVREPLALLADDIIATFAWQW